MSLANSLAHKQRRLHDDRGFSRETAMPRTVRRQKPASIPFGAAAREIAEIGKSFHARGWVLGTSGNLSAVTRQKPLRLAITASGFDKGSLSPSQILEIDAQEKVVRGKHKPSSEAAIHVAIVQKRAAGAVFHTHSTWGTILSETHGSDGFIELKGFEMLKGLEGVHSHEHTERLPILKNSQNMKELSAEIANLLEKQPEIHGLLLRKHGLYTWGATLREAKRHVEIIEFLMEVLVRSSSAGNAG
jgi:methylthioribulose-1-phosphate dehydratase